jgi:SAM-dependent methyltransferase
VVDAVSRFLGFADSYDALRPWPPPELPGLLRRWSGVDAPAVVDLGAGSGHSTVLWAGHAARVTAVEPGPDMRAALAARVAALPDPALVTVVDGTAEATGLPDGCADIVTASQAMHWFDPDRALPEVARLLKPGGVFAAYDGDWPPAIHAEVDAAYLRFAEIERTEQVRRGLRPPHAAKSEHLARMAASGRFAFTHEICLHHEESGDAAKLHAMTRTQGGVRVLLADGMTEDELGLTALYAAARRHIPTTTPWTWTYRVRLGVTP